MIPSKFLPVTTSHYQFGYLLQPSLIVLIETRQGKTVQVQHSNHEGFTTSLTLIDQGTYNLAISESITCDVPRIGVDVSHEDGFAVNERVGTHAWCFVGLEANKLTRWFAAKRTQQQATLVS